MSSFIRSLSCVSQKPKKSKSFKRKNSRKYSKEYNQNQPNEQGGIAPSAPPSSDYYFDEKQQKLNSIMSENEIQSENQKADESFWGLKNYKSALKRYDNGHKLCNDLSEMIEERAEIEQSYARALNAWNGKWKHHLETETVEYGTTRKGWIALLDSATKTAEIHSDTKKEIVSGPITKIKQFVKQKYQKHIINYKKTKELEDEFEEAQKSWAKLIEKMNKFRKEYYESIKLTRQTDEAARAADVNPKMSDDQRRKMRGKVDTCQREQENYRKRYEDIIKELDLYRPIYVENMTKVFEKTQNLEQERMIFFKQMFLECREILMKIPNDDRNDLIFEELMESLSKLNAQEDTEWWSNQYGIGTKAIWPKFEEYSK